MLTNIGILEIFYNIYFWKLWSEQFIFFRKSCEQVCTTSIVMHVACSNHLYLIGCYPNTIFAYTKGLIVIALRIFVVKGPPLFHVISTFMITKSHLNYIKYDYISHLEFTLLQQYYCYIYIRFITS